MSRLPPGLASEHEPLGTKTQIRTGGHAEYYVRVCNLGELQGVLRWAADRDMPVSPFGKGGNVLVADDGVRGVVLRLVDEFEHLGATHDDRLQVGGGVGTTRMVRFAESASLGGLEFAIGIPGTAGGAIRMNAGTGRDETLGRLVRRVLIVTGEDASWRDADEIRFRHRGTALGPHEIIAGAELQLVHTDRTAISERIAAERRKRECTQPVRERTFGSVWINPADDCAADSEPPKKTAWELVKSVMANGRIGDARVSPKHANFIENCGNARTDDVLQLMTESRRRVFEEFGYRLTPEVVFFGDIALPPLPGG